MNNFFEIKKFYTIIFIISLLSLLIALYIEFFLGYRPCKLCIYQRIPYLIAIFLTFIGISYYKNFILSPLFSVLKEIKLCLGFILIFLKYLYKLFENIFL